MIFILQYPNRNSVLLLSVLWVKTCSEAFLEFLSSVTGLDVALLKAQVSLQLGISSDNEVSVYIMYSYIVL